MYAYIYIYKYIYIFVCYFYMILDLYFNTCVISILNLAFLFGLVLLKFC